MLRIVADGVSKAARDHVHHRLALTHNKVRIWMILKEVKPEFPIWE